MSRTWGRARSSCRSNARFSPGLWWGVRGKGLGFRPVIFFGGGWGVWVCEQLLLLFRPVSGGVWGKGSALGV